MDWTCTENELWQNFQDLFCISLIQNYFYLIWVLHALKTLPLRNHILYQKKKKTVLNCIMDGMQDFTQKWWSNESATDLTLPTERVP